MDRLRFALTALAVSAFSAPSFADGTEQLGAFAGVVPAHHVAAAGIGLQDGQPGTITLALPANATVKQVLLYWEGLDWQQFDHGNSAPGQIGGHWVQGQRIGGPTDLFGASWSSTFRADVTSLALVAPGANSIEVGGFDFTRYNQGAGIVALYDVPGGSSNVLIADGNDIANHLLPGDFGTTAPVTFAIEPSDLAQQVEVTMFFAPWFADRCSVIVFSSGGDQLDLLFDAIGHTDGNAWCTVVHTVTVPAGATELTVRALPVDSGVGPSAGNGEQKFVWLFAALTRPGAAAPVQGGLTPGFWKNHPEVWDGKGEELTKTIKSFHSFNAVFGVGSAKSGIANSVTLIQAAGTGGGGLTALNRHAAAAVANADSDIGYPYTVAEVIAMYQATVCGAPGALGIDALKDLLEAANEIGYEFPNGKPDQGKGVKTLDDKGKGKK